MRAGWLCIAGTILLGAASPLWAAPFTEVPSDHWAYRACARLAASGFLAQERQADFSGRSPITRFEFGIALLGPLNQIDAALLKLPPNTDDRARLSATLEAISATPRQSEADLATALRDLRRLAAEFRDVLDSLGLRTDRVLRGLGSTGGQEEIRLWRLEALRRPASLGRSLSPDRAAGDSALEAFHLPLARGTIGLSLHDPSDSPELLDYLAKSAAAVRPPVIAGSGPAEAAITDPRISRLRTSYEYGIGSALTLSLAYEEIARRGQGLAALDAASLTSLGIGYQLSPSTSVKLSYSLLEYSNYALDTPSLRDRVAETAVSVEF